MKDRRPLIIGCGNPYAGDDAAGPFFIRRLDQSPLFDCDLLSLVHPDVSLLESFHDRDLVVIIDAVSTGSAPGTVHVVELPDPRVEPRSFAGMSGHALGIGELLDLGRALGRKLPRIVLVGIEIAQAEPGSAMSREVTASVDALVSRFRQVLTELGAPAFA